MTSNDSPDGRAAATRSATFADDAAPFPAAAAKVPPGFEPYPSMGGYIAANGPLYVHRDGAALQLGFRVEARHCNPMGICHGGMMATFCDMLLPLSAHHKSEAVAARFLPTINLQIDYLAPAPLGAWVQGEAEVLRVTGSMVFVQGVVIADGLNAARTSGILKIGKPFDQLLAAGGPAAR